ncbi:MAG: histidine kinase, partial [Flavobacteriales bacterium]|nr:histidine kinase [Flavobacteriales bacterium]
MLIGGGLAFFVSDRKRRQARHEKEAALLETQALRSQMNPHFIFNALNSVNAYVQR